MGKINTLFISTFIIFHVLHTQTSYSQTKETFAYQNPIRSGIDPKGLRDCQVLKDQNTWYLTGTAFPHWARQEQNGKLNQGVPLYKSTNLTDWTFVKYIIERPDSSKWYYNRFWAPEIHRIKGKYYATFNCSNPKHGYPGQHIGYAVSDSIEGPYKVITEEKPLANGNDLTLFEDEDGKVWAFWNRGREFGIGYAQLDLGTGKFLTTPQTAIQPGKVDYEYDKEGKLVQEPGYDGRPIPKVKKYYSWDSIGIEGAYVIKENGQYYLFYRLYKDLHHNPLPHVPSGDHEPHQSSVRKSSPLPTYALPVQIQHTPALPNPDSRNKPVPTK